MNLFSHANMFTTEVEKEKELSWRKIFGTIYSQKNLKRKMDNLDFHENGQEFFQKIGYCE